MERKAPLCSIAAGAPYLSLASRAAGARIAETYAQNERRWQTLLSDLTGGLPAQAGRPSAYRGD